MKLYRYNQFIKESKDDIEYLCDKYMIDNYTINTDGSIDVDGSVYLSNRDLNDIPLRFNKINGSFYCQENKLTSLIGSPKIVNDCFSCAHNELTSLIGCPKSVGENFSCSNNKLTSLEFFPEFYKGIVFVQNNPVNEIVRFFPLKKYDKAIFWLNEFEVIRNGKQVIMDRLEEVFVQMELDLPNISKFNSYEII